uniref:Myosin IXA n=1 Tax=Tetraodon nigroviridis TaxID=99883 RepID=H3CW19_TETNG
MSARDGVGGSGTLGRRQRFENSEITVRIYPGALAEGTIYCPISARKTTTAAEAIERVIDRLQLDRTRCYVLAEVKEFGGEEWVLNPSDCPVQRMMLWPRVALEHRSLSGGEDYRFLLRQKNLDGSISYQLQMWLQVTEERRRMVERGLLPQPDAQGDHADLCHLPQLNERSLLDNLRSRFLQEKIYTYVGSILIVINPFRFLPIYNPKYVKMYDNRWGKLEPHIYAVADVAYHTMLQRERNQCIVISGESGSGKTQSTNFLIHHLTALSQKGFASGVEQIILGAGPVLEAFGNAKTAHNNNSSRFGKFIQVNYQESGTVRGAYVEKYLLEKSRLVYQEHNERNYHVFYYLLAGASEEERKAFHLKKPEEYHYLSQDCFAVEGEDLKHDFERLQLAMEMVGFLPATRKQIFSLLSAILHLGNIRYKRKTYRDDSIDICNPEELPVVSELLEVKEEMLFEALTTRKTVTVGERLIVPYKLSEAGTVRDSMAKSLYSALFDWIVFRINHALLNVKDLVETTKILSIGVLDIFGFEDYENNSFEQFCINFANERLQHYFNQHIFKLEQEEYRAEGISWHNIDYIDNTGCIHLISKKPTALFHLLDEECNFPQATNQTLLDKFKRQHEGNSYIEFPAVMEPAFIIRHYAGKVKYGVKDFREKNTDHMRPDIVALLKSSKNAFICGLMGIDPSAMFRWAVLRAYFRALVAFREAGKRHTQKKKTEIPSTVEAEVRKQKSPTCRNIDRCCHQPQFEMSNRFLSTSLAQVSSSVDDCQLQMRVSRVRKQKTVQRRNKNYKSKPVLPKHLVNVKSLKYLSNLTLPDRITKSLLHLHKKKKPPSISAQFQASLNKLMETLGQSEPYFVKCIRSNAEKLPLRFNDNLVLRQLRYTGMLETVRIRQSGYYIKYSYKDFVHHFGVLLPEGTAATREEIQLCLDQLDLDSEGYQVGRTMVFLREAARQRVQALLHREVLRLIVALQRRFRAQLERRHFVRMRGAAVRIQRAWRSALRRRCSAALVIQAAWRRHRARDAYLHLCTTVVQLQALSRGYLSRQTFKELLKLTKNQIELCTQLSKSTASGPSGSGVPLLQNGQVSVSEGLPEKIMGLDLSTWEGRSSQPPERSLSSQEDERVPAEERPPAAERERSRTLDEPSQKTTRAKRENRRMRELEQAQFSLELLKPFRSPQGTPDSQSSKGSFELLDLEEEPPKAVEEALDSEDLCSPPPEPEVEAPPPSQAPVHPPRAGGPDAGQAQMDPEASSAATHPPKIENYLPTFYVPKSGGGTDVSRRPAEEPRQNAGAAVFAGPAVTRPLRERRESARRPVVVVISMQKETAVSQVEVPRTGESTPSPQQRKPAPAPAGPVPTPTSTNLASQVVLEKLERLNEEKEADHRRQSGGQTGEHLLLPKRTESHLQSESWRTFLRVAESRPSIFIPPFSSSSFQNDAVARDAPAAVSPPTSKASKASKGREPRERRRESRRHFKQVQRQEWREKGPLNLTNPPTLNILCPFQIRELEQEESKTQPMVDLLFKKALKEFPLNIFNFYYNALLMEQRKSIPYKDLYPLFEKILEKTMRKEQRNWRESPVNVWVKIFKVLLDEFMTEYKPLDSTLGKQVAKPEVKKRRKKDSDIVEEHNGHIFKSTQYSIPTYCEFCSSLIWMMDRACVCKLCRYACHRKCCQKTTNKCSKKFDPELSSRQFGVEVSRLTTDERAVPLVVEKLINYIEMHGLYAEGIYRKSGSANKIRELKQGLDTDVDSTNLDDYNIHVIGSVFKQWLRDLPNPLLTFELYEEFIRAMGLQDKKEMIRGVYSVIDQLSRTHLNTLERLVFHLVRIALQEETNRMSANALAIVFAPCILRCPDSIDPLQSVQDIGKTTACVELIICEQMNKYRVRLKDISSLEFAENKAKCRLTLIRRSMGKGHLQRVRYNSTSPPVSPRLPSVADVVLEESGDEDGANSLGDVSEHQQAAMQQEERVLTEQIESLQKEKEELTFEMLTLEPRASDDETLESEASIGTADSSENLNLDSEGTASD